MGDDLYPVYVAVALGFLNRYKAFGEVFRPAVAPEVGLAIRPPRNPPMPVLQMYEAQNQVGDGDLISRICVGCSWRELTSW